MTPDANQRKMAADITDIKVIVGRLDERITTLCNERRTQHDDHLHCRGELDREIERLWGEWTKLSECVNKLLSWGKALGIVGSALVIILAAINIVLIATGVRP